MTRLSLPTNLLPIDDAVANLVGPPEAGLVVGLVIARADDRHSLSRLLPKLTLGPLDCHWFSANLFAARHEPGVWDQLAELWIVALEPRPVEDWIQMGLPLARTIALVRREENRELAQRAGVADALDPHWLLGQAGAALLERSLRLAWPRGTNPPEPKGRSEIPVPAQPVAIAPTVTESVPSQWLVQESTHLAQILDCTIDGIAIVDLEGIIRYANPSLAKLFQRSVESLLGANLGLPIAAGQAVEVEVLRPDGGLGTGEMRAAAIQWLGQPAWSVAIRDITDRKQAESDLRYRLGLEMAVAASARQLAAGSSADFAAILEQIGRAARVTRVLLVQVRGDYTTANVISEWYDARSLPIAAVLNPILLVDQPWWFDRLSEGAEFLSTSCLDDLSPEERQHWAWLERYRVRSSLIAGIRDRTGQLWGALILGSGDRRTWFAPDSQLLRALGDTLYAYCDRQATQDRLRSSEELYAGIFERSDERIFLVRVCPDGRFTYETANPSFERATNCSAATIIGKSPYDLFPPVTAQAIVARFRACVAGGTTVRCEETLILGDRTCVWRTSLVPIRDSWNRTIKLLGSARDITSEREFADREAQQARYRQLLASITLEIRQSLDVRDILNRTVKKLQTMLQVDRVLFLRLRPDGSAKLLCEALGPNSASLDGAINFDWAISPDDPEDSLRAIALGMQVIGNCMSGNDPPEALTIARTSPNTTSPNTTQLPDSLRLTIPSRGPTGPMTQPGLGFGSHGGSTKLERLGSPTIITPESTEPSNPSPPKPAIEVSKQEILHQPISKPLSPAILRACQRCNIQTEVLVPVTTTSKQELPKELGYRSDPEAPLLLGILCLHQVHQCRVWNTLELDLLQHLANQLSVALYQAYLLEERTRNARELARSNQNLQEFAYVASHDLQEPLRGTIAFAELLASEYGPQLDDTAREYLRIVVESSMRMRQLIRDLLTLSRVGTRGQELLLTPANEALDRARENLRLSINESGATLQVQDLPIVRADALQLTQLFQNLIGNALKFRGQDKPKITVTAERGDRAWVFCICDNGIGVDSRYGDRIFQIFQRLHSRQDYEGTGIGLAICRKIVERHGGQIWVKSEPDQGSSFYFTLPDQPMPLPSFKA